MKLNPKGVCILLLIPTITLSSYAQKSVTSKMKIQTSYESKKMTWTSKSDKAIAIAHIAAEHYLNAEFPQAYDEFSQAVKIDPNFTVALTFLTYMSKGEVKQQFAERTTKSLEGKTEGEKLFASLADPNISRESRRTTLEKLHEMFPDGAILNFFYVTSRPTAEERYTATQEYVNRFPKKPWGYNLLGYMFMNDRKDPSTAKIYFEKYLELYPEGYNPYDSMGEYYMTIGDNENAKKYYTLALEKYPFNSTSLAAMEKLNKAGSTQVASSPN
ncbi:MAG: tetratricopeptide repeat protein [Candidatus Dadabacteria bacterium]